jgi:hypothetical protein
VGQWAYNDPYSAADWLKTLPADKSRERAITSFVDTISYQNPELAIPWVMALSDESERNSRMESSFPRWLQADENGAREWLAKSGLPAQLKEKLQNARPSSE